LVTVESVQLVRKKRHGVKEVIIGFSGAVSSAQAQNMAEYRLTKSGKMGPFTARHAKLLKLRSALYSGTSDTVTLAPRKPFSLRKSVQLRVSGEPPSGLHDTLGRLIDGHDDGQPGGDAVVVLHRAQPRPHRHSVRTPLSLVGRGSVRIPGS
jgi:hypothetical protein